MRGIAQKVARTDARAHQPKEKPRRSEVTHTSITMAEAVVKHTLMTIRTTIRSKSRPCAILSAA